MAARLTPEQLEKKLCAIAAQLEKLETAALLSPHVCGCVCLMLNGIVEELRDTGHVAVRHAKGGNHARE